MKNLQSPLHLAFIPPLVGSRYCRGIRSRVLAVLFGSSVLGTSTIVTPTPASSLLPTLQPDVASSTNVLIFVWLTAGAMLLIGLPLTPVTRTQEARVLETSREMAGVPVDGWLIPTVNGQIRLQKPPLAYWLTAISFHLFGTDEGSGELPAAISGWLTVGVTMLTGYWLFGARAALCSGISLLGSYLFFRHSRLAETDVLATLFVTAATAAAWRAFYLTSVQQQRTSQAAWFHLAAAFVALAALTKGPPALYPLFFLIGFCAIERRWMPLWRLLSSGAPLTFALLAAPWFLYAASHPSVGQLTNDLRNSATGGGHHPSFINYIPDLLIATAPWTAFVIIAVVAAAYAARHDHRVRGLLLWAAVILLPLCFWGNKQIHYLMPLMPPLMLLLGWLFDLVLNGNVHARSRLAVNRALVWTTAACALGAPAFVVVGYLYRGHVSTSDVLLCLAMFGMLAGLFIAYRQAGLAPALHGFVAGGALCVWATVGLWSPSLRPVNPRTVSSAIRGACGAGPFVFWGREYLPLCFYLSTVIPVARTDDELAVMAAAQPGLVLIEADADDRAPPKHMVQSLLTLRDAKNTYRVGRVVLDQRAAEARR
jgi:4-amino-4-deoxy-L-arabinose transferase-like glycosyltransferase